LSRVDAIDRSKAVKGTALPHVEITAVAAAVNTLKSQLNCGNPRTEVAAARRILALSNRFIEDDIKARISVLESRLRGRLKRQ
jgi:hypothetical protein